MTLKNAGPSAELHKARLVAQGHKDIDNLFVVHEGATLTHSSLRFIFPFASITGKKLWTQEVEQAYIQSDEPLRWPIFLRSPTVLQLPPRYYMKIKEAAIWCVRLRRLLAQYIPKSTRK